MREVGKVVWNVLAIFTLAVLLHAILKESLSLGWHFLIMFIVTLAMYVWKSGLSRLLENPLRIVLIWGAQVLIFGAGILLVAAKGSLLAGSVLTALILICTYLYIRHEVKGLQHM